MNINKNLHFKGLGGLEQLRKFDRAIGDREMSLFADASITLNRATLDKMENEDLDRTLDRFIIELSPYFYQYGCKQVLEWLIHKYQVSFLHD